MWRKVLNRLLDSKVLALSSLIAFANSNFIVAQMVQFLFERVENIVRKGKKCWLHQISDIFNIRQSMCYIDLTFK